MEREVIGLLAEGNTSKEVATILDCAVATVETHRARIMEKLGLSNVAQLIIYAVRHGLVCATVRAGFAVAGTQG